MKKNKFSEYDKAFFKDGYQLGNLAISKENGETILFEAINNMYHGIDQLISSVLERANKEGISVDCKKGCDWCCHQAVYANSYEIHYLGRFIEKNLSANDQNRIKEQAKIKNEKVTNLSDKEILNFKSPCPLLKDGICSAYEARPMACRIYLSKKVSTCLNFFNDPENKNNYPALLDFPLRAGQMMNEGFMAALKGSGTLTSEFRLEDGLNLFLNKS